MTKSPGHQQDPEHKVYEEHLHERIQAKVKDETIAESSDVIKLDEDGYPSRHYFPRTDVKMDKLKMSSTTTECPFKGKASYFNLETPEGKILEDAAWSYEQPYDEHADLKGRLAFYDDKMKDIRIRPRL